MPVHLDPAEPIVLDRGPDQLGNAARVALRVHEREACESVGMPSDDAGKVAVCDAVIGMEGRQQNGPRDSSGVRSAQVSGQRRDIPRPGQTVPNTRMAVTIDDHRRGCTSRFRVSSHPRVDAWSSRWIAGPGSGWRAWEIMVVNWFASRTPMSVVRCSQRAWAGGREARASSPRRCHTAWRITFSSGLCGVWSPARRRQLTLRRDFADMWAYKLRLDRNLRGPPDRDGLA
jgi:hypothetical protein